MLELAKLKTSPKSNKEYMAKLNNCCKAGVTFSTRELLLQLQQKVILHIIYSEGWQENAYSPYTFYFLNVENKLSLK